MSDSDPFTGEDWERYAQHCIDELVPMIEQSRVTISLVPKGPGDVKFAVELGFSIMLDKPIIAVVTPGVKVPGKLLTVADAIVEGDIDSPGFQQRLVTAIKKVGEQS